MRLVCDTYGLDRRSDPVGMVAESVRTTIHRTRNCPEAIRWMKSVAAWLHANREELEKHAR